MATQLRNTWRLQRTALLWLLLAVACLHTQAQVLGDVFIYTNNYTFDPFPDLPADFGPEVPDEGIDGLLRVADPEDACSPFTFSDTSQTWVALISRSQQLHPTNCTFDVKVRYAEAAGAAAAIVYDDVYEALIIMSKPRDHPDPGIPAVFVSEKAGIIMRRLLTPGQSRVRIVPVSGSAWMSLVMSAFLGFLALTVVLAAFYVMRSWSGWLGRGRYGRRGAQELGGGPGYGGVAQRPDLVPRLPACASLLAVQQQPIPAGLPACAIRALPVLVYEGKASRRRRSTPQPGHASTAAAAAAAAAAMAAGQPLSPMYASVSDVSWAAAASRAGSGMQQQQQQQQGSRLRQSDNAGCDADAAAEAALRAAAVFFPSDVLSSSAPAVVSSSRGTSTSAHSSSSSSRPLQPAALQQQQQQSVLAGFAQSPTAEAAGFAELQDFPLQRSSSGTPLSSPGYSTDDEEEPEAVMCAVSGVITAGPPGACGGATRRSCVVCLERYLEGDKVRVLPCQHRFHARCIDPWLANRRLCPVCKHDASQLPPPALQRELEAAAARAAAAGLGAAGNAAAGAGVGAAGDAGGGGGFNLLRRLRARFQRVQQQQQPAGVTGAGATALGVPATGVAGVRTAEAAAAPQAAGSIGRVARQLHPAALYAAAAAAADAAEAGLLLPGGLRGGAGLPAVASQLQQQQQQQQQPQRWRSRQRSAQRQFRQLAGLSQQEQHVVADLTAPLLAGSSSSAGGGSSSSRAGSSSSSRSQSRAASRMLPIPQLTPVQSDASSAGSPLTGLGPAS
uniref:RING-type E3 ubiquitin transferase n=1 Tax=Tetradesmus obliquus TaxID=3088 RepID=A0A383VCG0_TETOB|eukprot:jgi/Sobl393_1/3652/SZX62324.1